jgi:hypothetical protein
VAVTAEEVRRLMAVKARDGEEPDEALVKELGRKNTEEDKPEVDDELLVVGISELDEEELESM